MGLYIDKNDKGLMLKDSGLLSFVLGISKLDVAGLIERRLGSLPDVVSTKVTVESKNIIKCRVLYLDEYVTLEGMLIWDSTKVEVHFPGEVIARYKENAFSITRHVDTLLHVLEAKVAVERAERIIRRKGLRASILEDTFKPLLCYRGESLPLTDKGRAVSKIDLSSFLKGF